MKSKRKLLMLLVASLSFGIVGCNDAPKDEHNPIPAVDVETIDVDSKYVQEVTELIDSLTVNSTAEEIEMVQSKYNDLTEREKTLVTNYQKLEIMVSAFTINQLIESINEDNYSIFEVLEVLKDYDSFITKYGDDGEKLIKETVKTRLLNIKLLATKSLLNSANTIDLDNGINITRLALLKDYVYYFYQSLPDSYKEQITDYDTFLNNIQELEKLGGILYIDGYELGHQQIFDDYFDDACKMMLHHSDIFLNKDHNSVELDLDIQGQDWTDYAYASFFIKFDKPNEENNILVQNGAWSEETDIRSSYQLVDAETNLYYVEINLETLQGPFSKENNKQTFIQLYFSDLSTTSMEISDIVYLLKDYRQINNWVNKAVDIDTSTNMGKTQFALLASKIDLQNIKEKDEKEIEHYDQYISKKATINNQISVVYDEVFTTYYDNSFMDLTASDSDDFGVINSIDLPGSLSSVAPIYVNFGIGKNWSSYSKVAMFASANIELSSNPSLIVNDDDSTITYSPLVMFMEEINMYYLQFNLNVDAPFTGNPYVALYLDGNATQNISITNWVGIK